MSFCTGCSHFLYQDVHNTKMPDGSYARGPAWVCDSPEALRASQSEDNYDPNIHVRLIGGVCWSCRGEFYSWDGETEKPIEITRLEQFRAQLVEEKTPVQETPLTVKKTRAKSRAPISKKKRAEDPSKKRKSTNHPLASLTGDS